MRMLQALALAVVSPGCGGQNSSGSNSTNHTTAAGCGNYTCSAPMDVCFFIATNAGTGAGAAVANASAAGAPGCHHKPLLPLVAGDIEATIALLFGLALASAGGVGGGALVVPILMLLDGWGAAATVPFG